MVVPHTGTYQFSSALGIVDIFLKKYGYAKVFEGMTVGTDVFDNQWKKCARDPQFGEAQHSFIQDRYYATQMKHLQKHGIDLSKKGPAVHDAIWSTSVQFGPETSLIIRALKGHDPAVMSDEDIVMRIGDYKIEFNNQLFKSSSAAVRKGTLARARAERDDLVALARKNEKRDILS